MAAVLDSLVQIVYTFANSAGYVPICMVVRSPKVSPMSIATMKYTLMLGSRLIDLKP